MKFNLKDVFYIIIVLVLGFLLTCNTIKNNKEKKQYQTETNNVIKALNDSIKFNKKDSSFSKLVVQTDLNDFTKSELFKTLTKEKQQYFLELKKTKNLLASSQAQLIKKDTLISYLLNNKGVYKNDSVCYSINDTLKFQQKDTTNNLQYFAEVLLNKPITLKIDYTYKLKINTEYIKQKDKSIIVKYKFDDPKIVTTDINSFIIPFEDINKTKFQKQTKKNKVAIRIIANSIVFAGGVYVGYNIIK